MNDILDWEQIKKEYHNHWIQLVDFEWPEDSPYPLSGRVRISAPTRKEFNRLVLQAEPVDAARIYVGDHKIPEGTIIRFPRRLSAIEKSPEPSTHGEYNAGTVRFVPDSEIDFSDIPEFTDAELMRAKPIQRSKSTKFKKPRK